MIRVLVIVGCGSAKRDYWAWPAPVDEALDKARRSVWFDYSYRVRTDSWSYMDRFEDVVAHGYPTFTAKSLYTSPYAELKRAYAERFGHHWLILSAEHGLLTPATRLEPYNTHIREVDSDEWAGLVEQQIETHPVIGAGGHFDSTVGPGWIQEADRIEVLAGRQYIDSLQDVFVDLDAEVGYPFQEAECAGIGAQMGWLRSELDAAYPDRVNGWTFRPDAPYNGDVWIGDDGRVSLLVRDGVIGAPSAVVIDERLNHGHEYLFGQPDADGPPLTPKAALKRAHAWMCEHPPGAWQHPRIHEAAFDAPEGFELDRYELTTRQQRIHYHEREPPADLKLRGVYVEGYDSSGNFSVELARYPPRDEDRVDPDHTGREPVAVPDECGLEVALLRAHQVAAALRGADSRGGDVDPTVGQTSLGRWAE